MESLSDLETLLTNHLKQMAVSSIDKIILVAGLLVDYSWPVID